MKDIMNAPFLVEMVRTITNMYTHGWDERNGGNISVLLDELDVAEYLDVNAVIRDIPTGFEAPALDNCAAVNFTPDTFVFTYAKYTLGPGACGPATIIVPRAHLAKILKIQ